MPKFSVIIPVYNVAPYLRACLDSVIAAIAEMEKVGGEKRWTKDDKPLVEVICVDDGSTDGSGEILDEYAERVNSSSREFERDPTAVENKGKTSAVHTPHSARFATPFGRGIFHLISPPIFRVIHQQNAGVSAARNAALEVATGEWICFVDADDVVRESLFDHLLKVIGDFPLPDLVAYQKVEFVDIPKWAESGGCEWFDVSRKIPDVFAQYGLYQFVIRHDLLKGIRFLPFAMGEDLVFLCEVFARAADCCCLCSAEYAYRQRDGSAVRQGVRVSTLQDEIDYPLAMFRALATSKKTIGGAFLRTRGNRWLIAVPMRIRRFSSGDERQLLLKRWRENIGFIQQARIFSAGQKLLVAINRLLPCELVVAVTCGLLSWALARRGR